MVCWLLYWQTITTLCDSFKFVLVYFCSFNEDGSTDDVALSLYSKLQSFKLIYCLYCLADILYSFSMLSRMFQYKFLDISAIGSIIATKIAQLCMLFVNKSANLNASTFNEDIGFYILPNFGPRGDYLKKISSEIGGGRFHNVEMIKNRIGPDLKEALSF